ncbi:hypothetical protein OUZ56_028650 [Daphnia magna]|uniref:Uncharacterized protein n=1 Tax=Daphnia magna TaxID=35525 RepID=A0ABR0B4I1_9CRUS|nr:hypothetical protein OUZ56_028650 [Daphnia magna]
MDVTDGRRRASRIFVSTASWAGGNKTQNKNKNTLKQGEWNERLQVFSVDAKFQIYDNGYAWLDLWRPLQAHRVRLVSSFKRRIGGQGRTFHTATPCSRVRETSRKLNGPALVAISATALRYGSLQRRHGFCVRHFAILSILTCQILDEVDKVDVKDKEERNGFKKEKSEGRAAARWDLLLLAAPLLADIDHHHRCTCKHASTTARLFRNLLIQWRCSCPQQPTAPQPEQQWLM